jgi:hypothetical protein
MRPPQHLTPMFTPTNLTNLNEILDCRYVTGGNRKLAHFFSYNSNNNMADAQKFWMGEIVSPLEGGTLKLYKYMVKILLLQNDNTKTAVMRRYSLKLLLVLDNYCSTDARNRVMGIGIVTCMSLIRRVLVRMIGFISSWVTHSLLITLTHRQNSVISVLYQLQFTVAHALEFSISTSRLLATDVDTHNVTHSKYYTQVESSIHK